LSLSTNHHGPAAVDSLNANGFSPTKPPPSSTTVAWKHEEEEDYTIKCICGFHDDDGNTVLCEHCETWQHTECYYFQDGEVLDVSEIEHCCADCKPRRLDSRGATERQTMRREHSGLGDRRVKKAATKSHKKKVRASEAQMTLTNGSSPHENNDPYGALDRSIEGPREYLTSARRPKINHRYSGSLQSPQMSQGGNYRRSGSASCIVHSPSKTPSKYPTDGYLSEPFSHEFMHLYDDDPGDAIMQANLFNDITITSSLSSWTQDVSALAEATKGLTPQEIFHRCEQPLDSMGLPFLHKECREDDHFEVDGRHPRWKFLTTDSRLPKGSIVGELKGKVGHMIDYCEDPANRWDYLRHPLPFVFFHPKLPIYIDTRREGTKCRYLRRSCRPNLSMTTILENGSDYRFCFVAKDDLESGTELTIGWTLDQHIRDFINRRNGDQFSHQTSNDADEDYVSDWVGKVLADFGGCACDSSAQCSLAKYDRRSDQCLKGRNGYNKPQSPTIGHSINVGSQYVRPQEEDDDDRSTSESLLSKHRSRETTPTRRDAVEPGFAIGFELSHREKRKIAALEKNFEQIEQDRNQSTQKKKKRNSGGSSAQTPIHPGSRQHGAISSFSQPNTPGIMARPQYIDASTSRRTSGSPVGKPIKIMSISNGKTAGRKKRTPQAGPISISPATARPNYVSVSIQTEPDERSDWYNVSKLDKPWKPFMSLSKQLLLRSQRQRMKMEQRVQALASQEAYETDATHKFNGHRNGPLQGKEEVEIRNGQNFLDCHAGEDVANSSSTVHKSRAPDTVDNGSAVIGASTKHPPPPATSKDTSATELRMQLQSFVTQLTSETLSGNSREPVQSPVRMRTPLVQAPATYPPPFPLLNSGPVQPSPVKKKYSLGEYMSLRKDKGEPSSTGDKPSRRSPVFSHETKLLAGSDEVKTRDEGGAIVETPKQKAESPLEARTQL
ncbi:MAG: hypothetical protein LQ346_007390, partial [Caloplaca aetnensis]